MAAFFKAYFAIPGFRFSYRLRKCSYYFKNGSLLSKPLYACNWLKLRGLKYRFGFDISEKTEIGKGLYLGHFGGVVINPKAVIGKNVSIGHGVTLGKVQRGAKIGYPTIGDGAWIGPNAVIVGGITVGRNTLIGPGAYVNFDVPENSVVIGNPGQIVSDKGAYPDYASNLVTD
ncbi:serine acetyltransferase [Candidatus Falkowbacteria bacterium]|nr:serine acetyltransferase [Candidatus Falkowbacteria bacterium]